MMMETKFTPEDIEKNKDVAALSYVWVFSVIILLARRDSAFVRFHARQGFVLFLLSIALWPYEIARYGEYLVLPLMILGFIEAAQGHVFAMPVIAKLMNRDEVSLNRETRKLSTLMDRLDMDEKEIQQMKEEIHQVEEKVDASVKL